MDTRSFADHGFPATPVVHVDLNISLGSNTKCPHRSVYIASDSIRYNESSRGYLNGPDYRGGQITIASRGDKPATKDSRRDQFHLASGDSQISPDAATDRYLPPGNSHILRNGSR